MSINHRFFDLKQEHLALIVNLDTDPKKLSVIGETDTKLSPFLIDGDLDSALGHILVGRELSDEEKETKNNLGESFKTRDNMDELYTIYKELPLALNIVLSTQSFKPATYFTRHYENNWKIYNKL